MSCTAARIREALDSERLMADQLRQCRVHTRVLLEEALHQGYTYRQLGEEVGLPHATIAQRVNRQKGRAQVATPATRPEIIVTPVADRQDAWVTKCGKYRIGPISVGNRKWAVVHVPTRRWEMSPTLGEAKDLIGAAMTDPATLDTWIQAGPGPSPLI